MAGLADQTPLTIRHQSFLQDLRLPQDTQRLVPNTKSKVPAAVAFADPPQEARLLLHKSSFPHDGQQKPLKLQQLSKLYIDNSGGHHAAAGARQILRKRSCKPMIVSERAPRHNTGSSGDDEDGKHHRSTSARNFDRYTKTPGDAPQNGGQQVAMKANQGWAVHSKKNDFTLRTDSVMVVTNCSATSAACRICGRVFLSVRALGGHMRTHGASQFIDDSVTDLQDMREQQDMQQTSSNHRQDGTEELREFCRLGYDDEAITVDLTKGADHGKQLQRRRSAHFQIHCTGIEEDQCVEDKLPRLDNDQDDTAQLLVTAPLATCPHDGDGDIEDEADLLSPLSGASSASEPEGRRDGAQSCSGGDGDGGDDDQQLKLATAPDLDTISDGHPSPIKSFEGGPNMIERSRSYELRRNPKPNRRFVKDEQQLGRAPATANSSDSVSLAAKGYARSAATTSSRATAVVSSSEKRRSSTPSSTGTVSQLPSSAHSCTECGKLFFSWKALFGHMRCHPERQWRGIQPPSVVGHRHSSDSTVTTNQSTFDRHVLQGGVAVDAKMHRSRFKKKRPYGAAPVSAPNHESAAIVDDKTSDQVSTAADGTGGFTVRAKELTQLIGDGERMKSSGDHDLLHDQRFQQREISELAAAAAVTAEKTAKCRSVDDRRPSGPLIKKHVDGRADRAMAEDVDHSYDTVINGSSPDQVLSDELVRKKRSRGRSGHEAAVTRTDENRDQSSSSYVSLISDDGAVAANMNSTAGLGRGVQKGTAICSCTVADIPVDMAMAEELFPDGAAEIPMDQYSCLSPWRIWRTRSKRSKRRRVGDGLSQYHNQLSLRRPADQSSIPTIPSVQYPSAPSKIKRTASSSRKDARAPHPRSTQDHKLPEARDDSHDEDIDLDVANCLVFLSAGSGDQDASPPQKSSSAMAETDGSTQGLAATDRWRTHNGVDATKRSSKNQCNSTGEKCVDSHQTVRGHKASHCKQEKAAQAQLPANADPSRRIAIAIVSDERSHGRVASIRSSDQQQQLVSASENEVASCLRYKHEAAATTEYSLRSPLRHAQQRLAINRACTSSRASRDLTSSNLEQKQRQMESKLQMQQKSYNNSSVNDLQQSDVRGFRRFSVRDSDDHNQKSIGSGYSISTSTTAEAAASTFGRAHECSICHRLFPSGQALGGHKRCHWTGAAAGDKLAAADSSTIDAVGAGDSGVNYASSSVTSSNIGGNNSCNDMIKQLSACSNYSDDAQQVDQRSVDGMIGSASANILQVDLDVNRLNYSSTSLSSNCCRMASRRSVEIVGNRNDEEALEEDIEAPPSALRLFDLNLPAPMEMELQMDIS